MTTTLGEWYHAYTLQTQAYRETSLLITCFTRESGIISLVFRGAKRGRQPGYSIRQLFQAYHFQCQGKHELKTLTRFEPLGPPRWLEGLSMINGLYLNELLYRILPRSEDFPDIFTQYEGILRLFEAKTTLTDQAAALRYLEVSILQALGYGLDFRAIELDSKYRYNAEEGLIRDATGSYSGQMLRALAEQRLQIEDLQAAKGLMRQIFRRHFPEVQINSRDFYGALYETKNE